VLYNLRSGSWFAWADIRWAQWKSRERETFLAHPAVAQFESHNRNDNIAFGFVVILSCYVICSGLTSKSTCYHPDLMDILFVMHTCILCRSGACERAWSANNERSRKTSYSRPCWWKMAPSELHCMAEVSYHHHLSRSLSAACSVAQSTSHIASETNDVLPDICCRTGHSVFFSLCIYCIHCSAEKVICLLKSTQLVLKLTVENFLGGLAWAVISVGLLDCL